MEIRIAHGKICKRVTTKQAIGLELLRFSPRPVEQLHFIWSLARPRTVLPRPLQHLEISDTKEAQVKVGVSK